MFSPKQLLSFMTKKLVFFKHPSTSKGGPTPIRTSRTTFRMYNSLQNLKFYFLELEPPNKNNLQKERKAEQISKMKRYAPIFLCYAWLSIFSELLISYPSPLLERIDSAAQKGYRGSTKRTNKAH